MRCGIVHAGYLTRGPRGRQPASVLVLATLLLALLLAPSNAIAQAPATAPESTATTIGEIAGPDFSVKGQVEIATRAGRTVTRLASGNEVTVRRGQALVRMDNNAGSIRLCQPMRASLLKSDAGLTIAFERGTLRVELRGPETISLHTPWFTLSSPRAEASAERSALVSLDTQGKLCLKTLAGEWVVRDQLSNAQLAVPAGNEYLIEPNKLTEPERSSEACSCPEEQLEETVAPTPAQAATEVRPAAGATSETISKAEPVKKEEATAKAPPAEWKAIMPPLVFDARATGAPPAEPAGAAPVVLVPATWQGTVTAREASGAQASASPVRRSGLVERVKSLFRALFGGRKKGSSSG